MAAAPIAPIVAPAALPRSLNPSDDFTAELSDRVLSETPEVQASNRLALEELSVTLESDQRYFTWVAGSGPSWSRRWLHQTSWIFSTFILGRTSTIIPGKDRVGRGLYVSGNPVDSAIYALSEAARAQVNALRYGKQDLQAACQWAAKESLSGQGELLVITVKKGQKILDLTDPHILSQMQERDLLPAHAAVLNPNVVVNYAQDGRQWSVIKLRDSQAFRVERARVADFTKEQATEIRDQLRAWNVFGGHKLMRAIARKHQLEIDEEFDWCENPTVPAEIPKPAVEKKNAGSSESSPRLSE